MADKRYLMTPGPTPVPPQVLDAMGQPIVHHRGPDFVAVLERCLARIKEVFRTEQEVLLFTASGTGGMESAVANLCSPGERVLVVSAGYFGERWMQLAAAYGAEVEELRYEWGEAPTADDLAARLDELGGVSAVLLTQSETSTGVVADVQALASVVKEREALVVVDAVSSLGAIPCETDAWGLDVVVSGSQKALMTPPGLALVSVSPAAWDLRARAASPATTSTGSAPASGPGDARRRLHAGRLRGHRPRRRPRDAPRGRARGGLRAPRQARPRVPRGRQGDGARAVLA